MGQRGLAVVAAEGEQKENLARFICQSRFRLLEAECISWQIPIEYLCESNPEWIAHVEKFEIEITRCSARISFGMSLELHFTQMVS